MANAQISTLLESKTKSPIFWKIQIFNSKNSTHNKKQQSQK